MKIDKKILLKSVLYSLLSMGIIMLILHLFPSCGHPPLTWAELLEAWFVLFPLLLILIVQNYIWLWDSEEKKKKNKEKEKNNEK